MKTNWLKCFLAIEKYRSFSEAAESLFLSQSGLSKQLKALEDELGVQLFDRSTHTIHLTQAGEKIISPAQRILGEEERMIHNLADLKTIHSNRLSLAAPLGMSYYHITDMVINYELTHPQTIAETHEKEHNVMLHCLNNHIVDFCIGYSDFWTDREQYYIYPLYEDSLVIVMNHSHPFADMEEFQLEESKNVMFCLPREETGFFQLFLELCGHAGFSPRLTLSDVRTSTIKRYISHGMRLTVTSALRAETYFQNPEFKCLPIKGAPTIQLSLATRNEHMRLEQREFISHVQKWYQKKQFTI